MVLVKATTVAYMFCLPLYNECLDAVATAASGLGSDFPGVKIGTSTTTTSRTRNPPPSGRPKETSNSPLLLCTTSEITSLIRPASTSPEDSVPRGASPTDQRKRPLAAFTSA